MFKMCSKVAVFLAVCAFAVITNVSSLQCYDSNTKSKINCNEGEVCFRITDNTSKITTGCNQETVCKNIASNCTTCTTDLCNSGSDVFFLSTTLFIMTISILVFNM